MWPWPLTLWPWPLALNICSVSPVTWWNYVPNVNAVEQSAAELLRCQCLILWPWTCFKCCARLWDNFHQIWPSTTHPCLFIAYFDTYTSCHAVTLTFDLLTLKVRGNVQYIKRHVIKVYTKFEWNRAIPGWIIDNFANFCTRCVTLWPWPLTSWPWTFKAFWVSCA